MTSKPKHKIYHEFNFYIALGSFVGIFFSESLDMQFIMILSVIANIGTAQGLCNKHNIEELYKEKGND